MRSLRIGRIFKLLRKFKKLQVIFKTLTEAGASMASVGSLLILLIFMYSIMGMKFFGLVNY